jgi:hypothetical protein
MQYKSKLTLESLNQYGHEALVMNSSRKQSREKKLEVKIQGMIY